jgi:hypothetical protein
MKKIALIANLFAAALTAQQTVAPTTEPIGEPGGWNYGGYNITQSFELGYRFSDIAGNQDQYRSVVNFENGIRLLGSSLSVHSRDGNGKWFDEITSSTTGLGNDPYESATLRVRKDRIYNYDMTWRLNDFYSPAFAISNSAHLQDTTYQWQDHNVTLFPKSRLRIDLGYGRDTQSGLALSTVQLFDFTGSQYPLFSDLRWQNNSYRIGGELDMGKWRLTVRRNWSFFRQDQPLSLTSQQAVIGPNDGSQIGSFSRTEPIQGTNPGWLVNLTGSVSKVSVNGRFTYTGGSGNFLMDEGVQGVDRFGTAQNRETFVTGSARRPAAAADLAVNYFPTTKLTVINNTSLYSSHIDGNNLLQEIDFSTLSLALVNFQYLGFRLFTNSTEARYAFSKKFGAYGGYEYSDRRIRSIQAGAAAGDPLEGVTGDQVNIQHSEYAGFRVSPLDGLQVQFMGELSRANQPFFPISDRNFHGLEARASYRRSNLQLASSYRQRYNNNSIRISSYASHARAYSASASWTGWRNASVDLAYNKLHLDTLGGIAYFAGSPTTSLFTGTSLYISNIHAVTLGSNIRLNGHVDLYLGYSLTKDTGDGRSSPGNNFLTVAQTFPLTYQTPLARVSVKLNSKLRWNAGYQYYDYGERFAIAGFYENFHANTGYSSLLWSF